VKSVRGAPGERIWASDRQGETRCSVGGTAARWAPALRSVFFGSCYIYSPRGAGPVCELSRRVCIQLKLGDPAWLATYARLVREEITRHEALRGLFGRETYFVPVPSSSPLSRTAVWAAARLATALHGVGLGKGVWLGLRRQHAVRKSATALSGDRPTVRQHYESLCVVDARKALPHLLLIDDVVTRGRTILAAANRLHEALPNADIRAFALVRTMGLMPDVTHFLEPSQGVVRWAGGDARREP
jgi:predicted amidophosphoribosyltransferase